jgi:hypothetical protein
MITHNGTYLLHATHHGMPIYAATMGGKMVFGSKWLLPLTLQAIVAAFGSAEGIEVIAKTNDYLNRIALTDPQRAQLLAGFINEDPLLVCSLVETSKVRTLDGDGVAYIQTPFYATENSTFRFVGKVKKYQGSNTDSTQVLGYYTTSAPARSVGMHFRADSSSLAVCRFDGATATPSPSPEGSISEVYMDRHVVRVNGVESQFGNVSSFTSIMPMQIFRAGELGGSILEISNVEFGGDTQAHFIPMQRTDGTCGMLDIISGTFYPNANTSGSFTIAITDKTPA